MGQQLEQRGLARAVGADDAHGLAFVDCKADAVQRHKGRADQALVGADQGVGVLLAALAGPPALQVAAQRAAADLAEAVLLLTSLTRIISLFSLITRAPLYGIDKGLFDLAEKRDTYSQQDNCPNQRNTPHQY